MADTSMPTETVTGAAIEVQRSTCSAATAFHDSSPDRCSPAVTSSERTRSSEDADERRRRSRRRRADRPRAPRLSRRPKARAGHDRRALAHGLERWQPEPLEEGHEGEAAGLAVEPGELGATDLAGEDDTVRHVALGDGVAPPVGADDDERPRLGQVVAGLGVGLEQPAEVLARLQRADGEEEAVADAETVEDRAARRRGRRAGGGRAPSSITTTLAAGAPAATRASAATCAGTRRWRASAMARCRAASCQRRPRGG